MQLTTTQIRTDGGTQPRLQLDMAVIAEYAEAMTNGATFPPITVFYDGADYWLADGFHRLHAAQQLGLAGIAADVRQGTLQDAQWHSYSVNQSHGLRRTNEDKRRAVEAALQHPYHARYSDREIARHVGVHHNTIYNVAQHLSQIVIDRPDQRLATRNGTTYEMNTARIGKRADAPTLDQWARDNAELGLDPFCDPLSPYEQEIAERYEGIGEAGATPEDHWYNRPSLQTMHPAHRVLHMNANQGGSNEWYTPAFLVDAARATMGRIDLDPASCEYANRAIQAETFYTEDQDGLTQRWYGCIWMNPPYGKDDETNKSNQERWLDRLIREYNDPDGAIDQAIVILNAVTDRKWFARLWDYPLCFTGRVYFYSETIARGSPTHGSAIVYFGPHTARFVEHFRPHGRIVLPQGWYSEVLP